MKKAMRNNKSGSSDADEDSYGRADTPLPPPVRPSMPGDPGLRQQAHAEEMARDAAERAASVSNLISKDQVLEKAREDRFVLEMLQKMNKVKYEREVEPLILHFHKLEKLRGISGNRYVWCKCGCHMALVCPERCVTSAFVILGEGNLLVHCEILEPYSLILCNYSPKRHPPPRPTTHMCRADMEKELFEGTGGGGGLLGLASSFIGTKKAVVRRRASNFQNFQFQQEEKSALETLSRGACMCAVKLEYNSHHGILHNTLACDSISHPHIHYFPHTHTPPPTARSSMMPPDGESSGGAVRRPPPPPIAEKYGMG